MKEKNLSWEEFEQCVQGLLDNRTARISTADTPPYISNYLFRNQANSSWGLTTTLERSAGKLLTVEEYYRIVRNTKAQVETFTGKTWDIPSMKVYMDKLEKSDYLFRGSFPAYEYLIYLRHHSFPSPLLDWTRSPYIAAYFAFRNMDVSISDVSIYAYCEFTHGHKSGSSARPEITGLGPNVRSHPRHFQQQSEYTICTKRGIHNLHSYARHDEVFANNTEDQDELWKYNIPASERQKVLKRLENITSIHFHSLVRRIA